MIPSCSSLSGVTQDSSLSPSPHPGLLIVFEGMDGSGKSTQAKRLAGRLAGLVPPVLLTREPGGTPAGKKIREILLDRDIPLDPEAELFLFEADRVMHVKTVLLPALRSGKTVLSDRGSDATVAYQSFGAGLPREFVSALNRAALGGLVPDLTFLFDLPVAEMALRLRSRGDGPTRFELLGSDYFERVRKGYLELARIHAGRTVVLDATSGPDLLEEQIFGELTRRYPERFGR